jgi:hypothetical protein
MKQRLFTSPLLEKLANRFVPENRPRYKAPVAA